MSKELEDARVRILGPRRTLEEAERYIVAQFNTFSEIPIAGFTYTYEDGVYIFGFRDVLEILYDKSWVEPFNFEEFLKTHTEPIWIVKPGPVLVRYEIKK